MAGDVETKLAAARARLILEKPFLGALVLRLPLLEADPRWCPTSATDARSIYYCRQYIDDLSLGQVQFVLAHEALHCALSHFARRQHRTRHRWDVACDLAVNPLLLSDGLEAPPGALVDEDFAGLTAEEIYPCLGSGDEREPMDQHLYDGSEDVIVAGSFGLETSASAINAAEQDGKSRPDPLNISEREALAVQWQQRLAGAAQAAMRAGKLSSAMARLVDHLLQPQLPWRTLLDRYVSATARDDYNYMRPSSRRDGDAIMPSLRSSQTDVVVALDTSGSIKDDEIAEFAAEIDAIKGQVKARVTLLACAAQLSEDGPWTFEPWESFELPRRFSGSGGTNFVPVFDWVRNTGRTPDLLIYFTDAKGDFPEVEPSYPTMWLVKGREPVPWGRRVQLN